MLIGIDASRVTETQKTGTEYYSYNIILALLKQDKQNRYVLYSRENLDFPDFGHENISKKIIRMTRLWTQIGLAAEVYLNPPDILFIPAHTLPLIRPRGLKSIVTIHDLGYEYLEEYHKFPQRLYLNKSTVFASKHASHLIAVSQATKKDLVERLGVSSSRISVVYEGINKEIFKPQSKKVVGEVKEKYGLKEYLLFVGTIQPRKNLKNLILAYAQIYNKYDIDIVIAGKSGWLDKDIYQLPKELNIEGRVKFLHYVPQKDLPALYSGAKALTFPSLFEGFGLPIVEAFACGLPVLTSNVSSMPEVANNSALLINPYDIFSITKGLEQILSNNNLREQLTRKGFERAKLFSWEKAAKETIEIFNNIGNNR